MKKTLLPIFVLLVAAIVLFPSCEGEDVKSSSMRIYFKNIDERTLLPNNPDSLNVAKYRVKVTGPNGYDKTFTTSNSELNVTDIVIGNYEINAESLNNKDQVIAAGSTSVWLYKGNNTFTVLLDTLFGNGTFKANFKWNPKQVENPTVTVEFINQENQKVEIASDKLILNKTDGTFTISELSLPAGSYTMHAKIIDKEVIVSGLVEAVRIANGELTEGKDLEFIIGNTSVSMILGIKDMVASPITASLTATELNTSAEGIPENVKFQITLGELPEGIKSNDISVEWYLEGEKLEGQNSLELTHKPKPGLMRYDALLYHAFKGSIGSITINYKMPYYPL